MMDRFPRSLGDLGVWARSNNVTLDEARRRLAQYIVLCGIASIQPLRESLVFKGGNALDFVWQPNRSTIDLDFSLDMAGPRFDANVETLRTLLGRGLTIARTRFGGAFAVNSVQQQPPGESKTFITYSARIGYALSDEPRLLIRMANGQTSSHVIPVEISINEPIGAATDFLVDNETPSLRVCTVDDIVAEKLRALLQQKASIRNRHRPQDLLDIAVLIQSNADLDRARIAAFLQTKADARGVPVSRDAFGDPEVAERAAMGYEELKDTTRKLFIPFDEALKLLHTFVNELPISEHNS